MRGSKREKGGPDYTPEKSQLYRVLSNTGMDPLNNHKATKPAFNVGPSLARQRNAIEMVLRWRADDDTLCSGIWTPSPTYKRRKRCQSWSPLKQLSGSAHVLCIKRGPGCSHPDDLVLV